MNVSECSVAVGGAMAEDWLPRLPQAAPYRAAVATHVV